MSITGIAQYLPVSNQVPSGKAQQSDNQSVTLEITDTVEINQANSAKSNTSEILDFDDHSQRFHYYDRLFFTETDTANATFLTKQCPGDWKYHSVDMLAVRYEELREQIIAQFGNCQERLEKNLGSLDQAFTRKLNRLASSAAYHLENERSYAQYWDKKGMEPQWEVNKLALDKNFNRDTFEMNAQNMMKQFAQAFVQKIKSGMDSLSSMNAVVELMNRTTQTTSINNLSLSDFMILNSTPFGNAVTIAENIAARDNHSRLFNSNPNLSEFLRSAMS
ncbi:MAG: hypothetical protein FWH04_08580 [Oscillospiraceae bacterium]|nr:hypothetical protein [Oscillospiraceae bacterium]